MSDFDARGRPEVPLTWVWGSTQTPVELLTEHGEETLFSQVGGIFGTLCLCYLGKRHGILNWNTSLSSNEAEQVFILISFWAHAL